MENPIRKSEYIFSTSDKSKGNEIIYLFSLLGHNVKANYSRFQLPVESH